VRYERAEDLTELRLHVGERVDLESLRAAVVPPNLLLQPFLETPEGVEVEGEDGLDEDGVHGSVFHLRAREGGDGELVVGFRDLRTGDVTHRKSIRVAVEDGGS
jgi:hypothetical protein